MLTELRLSQLGVIDDATLAFGPGFTVISGETGAGKTMIVTGLGLLLGAKAESRLIRHGEARARVESRWRLPKDLLPAVEDLGGDVEDGEVLVSRVLAPSRSSAFVGGSQVPARKAAEITGQMITIHGQSEQIRLGAPERQREVLDRYAGPELATVAARYRALFERRRKALAELDNLRSAERERARELDVCLFGLEEIGQVSPEAGEDVALANEASRLISIEDLRAGAGNAMAALSGDDGDVPGAYGLVVAARKTLDRAAEQDSSLTETMTNLLDIEYALADATGAIADYLASLEPDPARFDWISARQADLQRLTRKYGPTLADVLAWEQDALLRVETLRASSDRVGQLEVEITEWTQELWAMAEQLRELRRAASVELSSAAEVELAALAMPHARLTFAVLDADLGPNGADTVTLLFAANTGSPSAPLAKVASGGELSRVRLALEVVLADSSAGAFVFDEVDAGVGGAVALEIGRRLKRLAKQTQVIVVTHLAQVAAFADTHLVVEKSTDGQVTMSDIVEVSGNDRLSELARMMAGIDTNVSLEHAKELLELGLG